MSQETGASHPLIQGSEITMARRKPAHPNAARDALLMEIAERHFFLETLETRNSDQLDFHVAPCRSAGRVFDEVGRNEKLLVGVERHETQFELAVAESENDQAHAGAHDLHRHRLLLVGKVVDVLQKQEEPVAGPQVIVHRMEIRARRYRWLSCRHGCVRAFGHHAGFGPVGKIQE